MTYRPLLLGTTFILTLLSLTSCGKGGLKLVQDAWVDSHEEEDGSYVNFTAVLDTAGLDFGITLPLMDPANPFERYGTVSLHPSLTSSFSNLVISVNVDKVAQGTSLDGSRLPNGLPIPVAVNAPVFGLKAGQKSMIYMSFPAGSVVVGSALVIKEFDGIGGVLPGPQNFFPTFKVSETVEGNAGIFTGPQSLQSGIAVFASVEGLLGAPDTGTGEFRTLASVDQPVVSSVQFKASEPSAREERQIAKGIRKLQRRGHRLSIR